MIEIYYVKDDPDIAQNVKTYLETLQMDSPSLEKSASGSLFDSQGRDSGHCAGISGWCR